MIKKTRYVFLAFKLTSIFFSSSFHTISTVQLLWLLYSWCYSVEYSFDADFVSIQDCLTDPRLTLNIWHIYKPSEIKNYQPQSFTSHWTLQFWYKIRLDPTSHENNYDIFCANKVISSYELTAVGTFSLPVMIVLTVMSCFLSIDYHYFPCFTNTNGIITHLFFCWQKKSMLELHPLVMFKDLVLVQKPLAWANLIDVWSCYFRNENLVRAASERIYLLQMIYLLHKA